MLKPYLSAACLAAIMTGAPASAQEEPTRDTVLATVGETEITLGHAISLRASLPEQYDQVAPQALFEGVLDQLIQQTLLLQAHDGDLSAAAQLRLDNERRAIVASDMIASVTGDAVTEAAIRDIFESDYSGAGEEIEYRAAHILVETEEEAQDLAEQIADGTNFAALAQEHSIGPSGPSGGKLGWFGDGVMVPDFFEAVTALEVGEVSAPVETQFGWHLIKLDETRDKAQPELEQVRAEIADTLRRQALDSYLDALAADTAVERSGIEAVEPAAINRVDLLEN